MIEHMYQIWLHLSKSGILYPQIWETTKSTFRKKIRNKLFEILSKSDDYLEITEIMHQLKFN